MDNDNSNGEGVQTQMHKCAFPPCQTQIPVSRVEDGVAALDFCERHDMDTTRAWVVARGEVGQQARALVGAWRRRGKERLTVREEMLRQAVETLERLEA